jgi:hypothetical protein
MCVVFKALIANTSYPQLPCLTSWTLNYFDSATDV